MRILASVCVLVGCVYGGSVSLASQRTCEDQFSSLELFRASFDGGQGAHDSARESSIWSLDGDASDALELRQLARAMSEGLLTMGAHRHLLSRLQSPNLSRNWIKGVQDGVSELALKQEVLEGVQAPLTAIRNVELRTTRTDRLIQAALKTLRLPITLRQRPLNAAFLALNRVDESWFIRLRETLIGPYGAIAAYAILAEDKLDFIESFDPPSLLYAIIFSFSLGDSGRHRKQLWQIKGFFEAVDQIKEVLMRSESAYLRGLGQILSATEDENHPLKLADTVRGLKGVVTLPGLSGALDLLLISNFSINPKLRRLRLQLAKVAVLANVMSEVDVLQMMAVRLKEDRDLVFPTLEPEGERSARLEIHGGRNPLLHFSGNEVVPNDLELGLNEGETQVAFVTGPNAAGKSTYLRMIAQVAILAMNGFPVPATGMSFTPMPIVSTSKRSDSTLEKESLFRAEARRVSEFLTRASGRNTLVFVDEIFSGTSAEEKMAAEQAFYQYLSSRGHLLVSASHTRHLSQLEGAIPGFRNFQFGSEEAQPFEIRDGFSEVRNAFLILDEESLPSELVDLARALYSQSR